MTCKSCQRAVYDTDVDKDGLCCFCSPAGETLTGMRPATAGGPGQAADFGTDTPVKLHGVESVDEPPEDEPRKRGRRKGSALG